MQEKNDFIKNPRAVVPVGTFSPKVENILELELGYLIM